MSGNVNTYALNDLSPLTEYEVLLSAVYRDEAESSDVSALETTCKTHVHLKTICVSIL